MVVDYQHKSGLSNKNISGAVYAVYTFSLDIFKKAQKEKVFV
jgi:hypothetical protein